jgi:hypothetical protein
MKRLVGRRGGHDLRMGHVDTTSGLYTQIFNQPSHDLEGLKRQAAIVSTELDTSTAIWFGALEVVTAEAFRTFSHRLRLGVDNELSFFRRPLQVFLLLLCTWNWSYNDTIAFSLSQSHFAHFTSSSFSPKHALGPNVHPFLSRRPSTQTSSVVAADTWRNLRFGQ